MMVREQQSTSYAALGQLQGVQDCHSLSAGCKGLDLPKVRKIKIIYPGYEQQ